MQSQRYFEREREPEETEGLKTEENRGRERQPEMEIKTNPEASRVGETRGARGEAPGEAEREERRGGGAAVCDRPEAAASPPRRHHSPAASQPRVLSGNRPRGMGQGPSLGCVSVSGRVCVCGSVSLGVSVWVALV